MRHLRSILLAAAAFSAAAGAAPRPNILFILTEDQGAHMGCLGTPGLKTPRMDGLAATGMLFRNGFIAYPVCSASKAALYTALHNHANGILNNTVNMHKPAEKLTPAERRFPLYVTNRIRPEIPTLTEILRTNGYYQGTMHKLHVAPVEKFPYDEFLPNPTGPLMKAFLGRAAAAGKPWFLLYNIPNTHRPYPDSDKVKIRVDPAAVKLPAFLPDTPVVRKDWAEYLAGIEEADAILLVGTNPRREAPLINARIRKRYLHGRCPIGSIGTADDLTYPIERLGAGPATLRELVDGKLGFFDKLKDAKHPLIVVGMGALAREDGAAVMLEFVVQVETCRSNLFFRDSLIEAFIF